MSTSRTINQLTACDLQTKYAATLGESKTLRSLCNGTDVLAASNVTESAADQKLIQQAAYNAFTVIERIERMQQVLEFAKQSQELITEERLAKRVPLIEADLNKLIAALNTSDTQAARDFVNQLDIDSLFQVEYFLRRTSAEHFLNKSVKLCEIWDVKYDDFCAQAFTLNTEVCEQIEPSRTLLQPSYESQQESSSHLEITANSILATMKYISSSLAESAKFENQTLDVISAEDKSELASRRLALSNELQRLVEIVRNCNISTAFAAEGILSHGENMHRIRRIEMGAGERLVTKDLREKPNFWLAQNNPDLMNGPYRQFLADRGIYYTVTDFVKYSSTLEKGCSLAMIAIVLLLLTKPAYCATRSMVNTVHNWYKPASENAQVEEMKEEELERLTLS